MFYCVVLRTQSFLPKDAECKKGKSGVEQKVSCNNTNKSLLLIRRYLDVSLKHFKILDIAFVFFLLPKNSSKHTQNESIVCCHVKLPSVSQICFSFP